MSISSLLIVLFSAVLHVVVHVTLKRAKDRNAFIWWMWFFAATIFSPLLFLQWQAVPNKVWLIMLLSAICDTCYYAAIARAYSGGDLSIVYPLSRGIAPVFISLWSTIFLKERPSYWGLTGIALIVSGLFILNLPYLSAWRQLGKTLGQPAARWALAAGLFTSFYTTIDRVGIGYLPPLLYTYLTMLLMLICLTPGIVNKVGIKGLIAEGRISWGSSFLAGFFALLAYMLIMLAMNNGLPTSYVGATREISAVFSTIIGVVILKEPGTKMRFIGSVLIAGGASTIAFLG